MVLNRFQLTVGKDQELSNLHLYNQDQRANLSPMILFDVMPRCNNHVVAFSHPKYCSFQDHQIIVH